MDTQATLSIASINLEEPHLKILKFLLSYYFKDRFSLTETKDSNVKILHINSDNANKKFDQYQKNHPESLFIIISNKVIENSTTPIISLPVTPRKLSDALYQISDKLKSTSEHIAPKKTDLNKQTNTLERKNNHSQKKIQSKKQTKNTKLATNKKTKTAKGLEKNTTKKETNKQKSSDSKQKEPDNINVSNRVYTKQIEKTKRTIAADIYVANTHTNKLSKEVKYKPKTEDEYDFYLDLDGYVEEIALDHLNNKSNTTNNKSKSNQPKEQNTKKKTDRQKKILIAKDKLNFMSSRPDIDLDNASLVAKINYKPSHYLQGYLKNIYNNPRLNSLDISYGIITYNKKNHTAAINVNDRTLQNISSIGKLKAHYLLSDINDLSNDKKTHWENADTVLWKVTIWASRGRLPQQFNDIDVTFSLKYWPNLTRFMMTPHAMEIAALWSNKPISLRKTLDLLNIPQRYVFSFYSAAIALDLIIFEKDKQVENPISHAKKSSIKPETKRKGVFGKLLKYFKPNNIEEI